MLTAFRAIAIAATLSLCLLRSGATSELSTETSRCASSLRQSHQAANVESQVVYWFDRPSSPEPCWGSRRGTS